MKTTSTLSFGAVIALLANYGNCFTSPILELGDHLTCPSDIGISCSSSDSSNSCCFESPGGVVLSTQFWDANPGIGANDTFTLHGLWPDNCDGTYEQFCDPGMEVSGLTQLLTDLGQFDLLTKMKKIWLSNDHNDESLWEHEFNKHGTCMSTIKSQCYGSGANQYQYLIDYYTRAVTLWEGLPTYQWLEEAGIVPSNDKTYTLAELQSALSSKFNGFSPRLGCSSSGELNEIWWMFHLRGSITNGEYIPIASLTADSCPATGIKYLPKVYSDSSSTDSSDKGYITIPGQTGCLISDGSWFTSGTCATYYITKGSAESLPNSPCNPIDYSIIPITLTSSKGNCDVVDGAFSCAASNELGQFLFDTNLNYIIYDSTYDWSADSVPAANQKIAVSSGDGGALDLYLQFAPK